MRNVYIGFSLLLAMAATTLSCRNADGQGAPAVGAAPTVSSPNAPRGSSTPTAPPVTPPGSTKLKSGAAPMNFVVGLTGTLRIIDVTDQAQVLSTPIAPQSVVTVDAVKGISVSNKLIKAGPLPRDHRYEAWLDPVR